MKTKLTAIALGLLLCFTQIVFAQELDISKLESTVQEVVERVRPATVAVRTGDGDATGVIVSKEGHVFTAGHCVMEPGSEFVIELADGRRFDAVGMGLEPDLDCGLIKIKEPKDLPFVELGWSSELVKNQPCISLGHSNIFNKTRGSVVRFGRIVEPVSTTGGYIQSTCMMEPGDSGGPLFDLKGRLIGIHSQCDETLDENFEVPVDVFRRYWDLLNKEEAFRANRVDVGPDFGMSLLRTRRSAKIRKLKKDGWALTQGFEPKDIIKKVNGNNVSNSRQLQMMLYGCWLTKKQAVAVEIKRGDETKQMELDFASVICIKPNKYTEYKTESVSPTMTVTDIEKLSEQFSDLEEKLDDHCVPVTSDRKGKSRKVQGTVLSTQGRTFVVCKNSIVGENPKALIGEKPADTTAVFKDEKNDLLILEVSGDLPAIKLDAADSTIELGEFLISPHSKNSGQVSVRGAPQFSAKARGYLGVMPGMSDDQVVLKEVMEDSAADAAGLESSDIVLTISGQQIDSTETLVTVLMEHFAGEQVEMTIKRGDELLTKTVTLGGRDDDEYEENMIHVADMFKGGKSKVRSGFANVIAHDARVQARDCGGPVFDTDGNFVGINIARYSRTQCYILPKHLLKSLLENAINKE